MSETPSFTGSKKCGECGREVHVLAHACPKCGGEATLISSLPQDELAEVLRLQQEARELVDRSMNLMNSGQFSEAERILKQAQEINPQNACAFGNLGGVYFMQERYAEAIPWLEKALTLDPKLEGIPEALANAKRSAKGGGSTGCLLVLCAVIASCSACGYGVWQLLS
jgi:tetratricopeptide (TPR) repeat protein